VYIYREFGGNFWIRDNQNRLAIDLNEDAPAVPAIKKFMGKKFSSF